MVFYLGYERTIEKSETKFVKRMYTSGLHFNLSSFGWVMGCQEILHHILLEFYSLLDFGTSIA